MILSPGRRIDFPNSSRSTASQHAITTTISRRCQAGGRPSRPPVQRVPCHRPKRREQHDRQPGKERSFSPRPRARTRPPEPQPGVGGEVRVDVGGKALRLGQRPRVEAEASQLEIRQQERQRDDEHHRAHAGGANERPSIGPQPARRQLPGEVEGDDRAEEQQVVAARQVLRDPRDRGAGERAQPSRGEMSPQAVEDERHPRRREHLQVRDRRDAEGREGVREAGHEAGRAASGQFPGEQKHPEAREDERRQEDQVVAEDRVPRGPVDRQRLQPLRKKVLGVRERQRMRREDVGAPPAAAEMRRIPRHHPGAEQRIAEVPRDVAREAERRAAR